MSQEYGDTTNTFTDKSNAYTSKNIQIKKRNGSLESFNPDKINKVLQWAVQGVDDVSFEEVAMNAHLSFFDGMTTRDIHLMLIESAANLISEDKPDYQYVAGNLLNYQLRKEVWGGKNPPKLYDLVNKNILAGVYDKEILKWYSKREFNKLDEFLKHERDFIFTYAGIRQLCDKYLVQNRTTKEIFETPQFAYMLIAMTLFRDYKADRLDYIKKAYDYFSKHKINLPTPLMAGVRTPLRSYSSCVLIKVDDTLDSIFASNSAVGLATANRYGIGVDMGRIRATNAPIRGGDVVHTGVIPFLKVFESTVKSCHQNSIRGGSATVNFPWFHYDILDIIPLKNNSGTDDNRVRRLDYAIGLDKVILTRFLKNKDITLFSYHEVPELWNVYGLESFKDLYEKLEKRNDLKFKKTISARELMSVLAKERLETGRIYTFFADNANKYSPWKEQITMGNLCQEILQPLIPLQDLHDKNGEIGVCTLAAVNWLEVKDDEMKSVCNIIVRMLDALIDHQEYFVVSARNFAVKRRSLGVGITNLAAYLAKEGYKYQDKETPNIVARQMERMTYYLIDASCELAKELGKCEKYGQTKFSDGVLCVDNYKKDIDSFVTEPLHCDWEKLRAKIAKYGLRNSTLTAIPPIESSSVIQSSTNGIEPPRGFVSFKGSKTNIIPVVVPNLKRDKKNYTLAYEMPDNQGYLRICAAISKFTDMAISANNYYSPNKYESKRVPAEEVIKDILTAYKYGLKSLYYANTDDGNSQSPNKEEQDACNGSCKL